jgi:predicted metal-dependent enzyme (double-stranded beta helix superfamily)
MSKTSYFDLDRFIDDIRAANAAGGQPAVDEVLRAMLRDPDAIMATLGEPENADLHKLYSDDAVTILNVIWPPLISLLPHNHNMWASIGIYTGRENNIIWERRGGRIEPTDAAALCERDVYSLPVDAIHSVTNPIEKFTGAIHVYGGNFFAPGRSEWDAETLEERPYDLEAARVTFAKAAQRFLASP